MKNIKLFTALLLAGGLILGSCGTDEPEVEAPLPTGPSSFIASPDSVAGAPGDTFSIALSGSSANALSAIYISEGLSGLTDTLILDGSTFVDTTYTITIPSSAVVGDEYFFSFSLEDTDGSTYRKFASTVATATLPPLSSEFEGTVYHIDGTGFGSYDFVNDVAISITSPNSIVDLQNTNQSAAFDGSWTTLNSTRFFFAPGFDWNNATTQSVTEACEAGTPETSITAPADGEVYIVQLRDGSHAVMLVTLVDPIVIPPSGGTIGGELTFVYKK